MSAAWQRRERSLDRERASIPVNKPLKKSSKQMRRHDHGLDSMEEQAARSLSALMRAREHNTAPVVVFEDSVSGAASGAASSSSSPSGKGQPRRSSKSSPFEGFLAELQRSDGGSDAALLPPWLGKRWLAAIAAARSAENSLGARLGARPTLAELQDDPAGAAAMEHLAKLREVRSMLLSADGDAAVAGEELYVEALMQASGGAVHASGAAAPADETAHALFRGYSRELLRVRQQLTQSAAQAVRRDASDGLAHAGAGLNGGMQMLGALGQRASADAAVLEPPALLPGVALDAEQVRALEASKAEASHAGCSHAGGSHNLTPPLRSSFLALLLCNCVPLHASLYPSRSLPHRGSLSARRTRSTRAICGCASGRGGSRRCARRSGRQRSRRQPPMPTAWRSMR